MFQPKASKREAIDNSDITVDDFHNYSRSADHWKDDYIQFGSFDPGVVNFGVRVERRYHSGPYAGKITSLLYDRVKPVNVEPKKVRTIYSSMTEYLSSHDEELRGCHIFVIERQMAVNYQSVRMQQHVQSYLMTTYKNSPLLPIIVEIDAKAKLHKLGCPTHFNKNGYKKWSEVKAAELLKLRGDTDSYNKLAKAGKKDDLADVVCQIEALCVIYGFFLTPETPYIPPSIIQPPIIEIISQ